MQYIEQQKTKLKVKGFLSDFTMLAMNHNPVSKNLIRDGRYFV